MPQENLERFRRLVLEDLALQEKLKRTPDRKSFIALAVELGRGRGCDFTAEDVEAALASARLAWLERWV
jgi:hypothetical protein